MVKKHSDNNSEYWYYDSCTLDKSKSDYGEMFNRTPPIKPVISFLSIGEAFGNSYLKGEYQLDAFVDLMKALKPFIKVVENDGSTNTLTRVREVFTALSITDALHIATAIENNCVCVRTTDRDLYGLSKEGLKELCEEFNLPSFTVRRMF